MDRLYLPFTVEILIDVCLVVAVTNPDFQIVLSIIEPLVVVISTSEINNYTHMVVDL